MIKIKPNNYKFFCGINDFLSFHNSNNSKYIKGIYSHPGTQICFLKDILKNKRKINLFNYDSKFFNEVNNLKNKNFFNKIIFLYFSNYKRIFLDPVKKMNNKILLNFS